MSVKETEKDRKTERGEPMERKTKRGLFILDAFQGRKSHSRGNAVADRYMLTDPVPETGFWGPLKAEALGPPYTRTQRLTTIQLPLFITIGLSVMLSQAVIAETIKKAK